MYLGGGGGALIAYSVLKHMYKAWPFNDHECIRKNSKLWASLDSGAPHNCMGCMEPKNAIGWMLGSLSTITFFAFAQTDLVKLNADGEENCC